VGDFYSNFLNVYCLDIENAQSIAQREQPLLSYYSWRKAGGRSTHQRFILAGPRGSSASFAAAQAVSDLNNNSDHYEWQVPPGEITGSIQVQYRDIALSAGDQDAAARAAQFEIDAGTKDFAQQTVRLLLGQGYGAVGPAYFDEAATNGSPTFSLQFQASANNTAGNYLNASKFQIGDQIEVSTDPGGTGSVSTAKGYVLEVDWEVGYVRVATTAAPTVPANPGTGWSDNTLYYVWRRGDWAGTSAGLTNKVISWQAYVPSTKATDTLANVNRAASSALSGARLPSGHPAAGGTLAARAKALISFMRAAYGSKHGTLVVLNPTDFDLYDSQLDVKTRREPAKSTQSGYMSLTVNTANGATEIVSEPEQPQGTGLIVDPSEIELESTNGKIYDIVKPPDGSIWNLRDTSNVVEARPVTYLKHLIGAPYRHGRFSTL
jgi:hypothetical protein